MLLQDESYLWKGHWERHDLMYPRTRKRSTPWEFWAHFTPRPREECGCRCSRTVILCFSSKSPPRVHRQLQFWCLDTGTSQLSALCLEHQSSCVRSSTAAPSSASIQQRFNVATGHIAWLGAAQQYCSALVDCLAGRLAYAYVCASSALLETGGRNCCFGCVLTIGVQPGCLYFFHTKCNGQTVNLRRISRWRSRWGIELVYRFLPLEKYVKLTNFPASMMLFAFIPISVLAATAARSMSPVAKWHRQ